MASSTIQAALLVLSLCLLLLSTQIGHATSLSYNFSDPTSISQGDLQFEGDAYAGDGSVILAKNKVSRDVNSKASRVSYNHPVLLWSNATTGKAMSFSTTFSFVMNGGNTGGGQAFLLAPYSSSMPLNLRGGYLGLFISTRTTTVASTRVVQWSVGPYFLAFLAA